MSTCMRVAAIVMVFSLAGCARKTFLLPERPAHGTEFVVEIGMEGTANGAELAERVRITREIIGDRLDDLGVEHFFEKDTDGHMIVVVPPQLTEKRQSIRNVLTQFGWLEFRRVHPAIVTPEHGPEDIPPGNEVLVLESERNGEPVEERLWVKQVPELNGSAIKAARVMTNQWGKPAISIEFTSEARERFRQLTHGMAQRAAETGKPERLAIVIDGSVFSAPVVREEVSGGIAQITGKFTEREARELCNLLNNPLNFRIRLVAEKVF